MTNSISPQQAHEWLRTGQAILIDVRESNEFQDEHITYALSLPLSSIEYDFQALDIPDSKKIIFQCLKGTRGEKACTLINQKYNYPNDIYNIKGGIFAWKDEGLPLISKVKNANLSIFRQVQIIVGGFISFLILLGLFGIGFGFIIAGMLAFALFIAGLTGWCGLALFLSKMPWNKTK